METVQKIARKNWGGSEGVAAFDAKIVDDLYDTHLKSNGFTQKQIAAIEFTHYLELYLWPNFDPATASMAHVMSIVLMVNEKFREQNPGWLAFTAAPIHFAAFFDKVMDAALDTDKKLSVREHTFLVVFLNFDFSLDWPFRVQILEIITIYAI